MTGRTLQTQITPGRIILQRQAHPPVDVTGLAQDFGINVWEMHTLGENISGKIFLDPLNGGSSGYSIGVKASEGYRRKRFTIAHEIAHFILHRPKIGDELVDDAMYRSGLSTREEAQANQLAADILMPTKLIKQLQLQGFTDVPSLANKLEVSEAAMQVRLSYLS